MSKAKFILGVFEDPDKLMEGIDDLLKKNIAIYDAFTPMPIHGIEKKVGIGPSRLPQAAFWFGFLGTTFAISLITYVMVIDWPLNIGGKPYFAFPNYIPVTFELTVLFASFGMTFTYYYANHLFPGRAPRVMDIRATDDKFIIAIDAQKHSNHKEIEKSMRGAGAVEVKFNERKYISYDS